MRDSGELAEAKSCYAEALRLNPNLALSYSNMGQVLQEEGNLPEAIAWYERGLQYDSRSSRINCNLASAYEEREDFQGAVVLYRTALELDPQYAEAHNGLGYVLHELGKFPEAVAEYREVLRLKPDFATGYCNLGNILEELGSFDEALAAFRDALRRDPEHAGAYSLLATMLRDRLPAEDLQAIQRLLARPQMTMAKRLALHFGIAHVFDGVGSYAEIEATGSMDLTHALNLEGAGPATTAIDGADLNRVFLINPTAAVTVQMSGITIRDGSATGSGGGIYVQDAKGQSSSLTLTDCIVTGNTVNANVSGLYGGGIALNNGNVTLTNSQVIGNHVLGSDDYGGGLGVNGGINGGGTSNVTLSNSTISGNSAGERGRRARHDLRRQGQSEHDQQHRKLQHLDLEQFWRRRNLYQYDRLRHHHPQRHQLQHLPGRWRRPRV